MNYNGNLYIIGLEFKDRPHKVGVTNNIRSRFLSLQSGNPYRLAVKGLWKLSDEFLWRVEDCAHALLNEHRMVGEWFDVTDEVATTAVLSTMNRLGAKEVAPEVLKACIPIPEKLQPVVSCWERTIYEFGYEAVMADLRRLAPPRPGTVDPALSDWIINKTQHMGVQDGAAWVGLTEDQYAERVRKLRRQEMEELTNEPE